MTTTWLLSINEGPNQKQISQALKATAGALQMEEIVKLDPDSTEEEAQAAETTQTRKTSSATFARYKDIAKRNAVKE